ncbi:MAG: hypothetical protein FJ219_06270 [Ignavibacteria bacterium]|nr:hypothetical protein [Ignavibacteria bacterium]
MIYVILLTSILFSVAKAQDDQLSLGFRLQHSIHMYNEHGITIDYTPKKLLNDQLSFGATYVSTRFGSAINSNAILQDNILFHSTYVFSSSSLSPLIRLNAGYCFADYESSLFDDIDPTMPLLSIETGVRYAFDVPLNIQAGLGYNLITSDGSSGIGTVYPLFVQCTLLWSFSL